jgi:hypothetical protein
VIYAHEFAWDPDKDPAWPRLQKIFGFYDAKSSIVSVFGKGSVKGPGGPDNTHCNHIGAVHRKGIHPALKEWFGIPMPEEYSKNRPAADLRCWTEEARKELQPKSLAEVVATLAAERKLAAASEGRNEWAARLGNIEAILKPTVTELRTEEVPGGTLARFTLETDPGITVPVFLITPKGAPAKVPVVVMTATGGKQAFLAERNDAVAEFLNGGVAVCLVDVRGTGETRPGSSADRGSARTSISQTNLILGQPVLGSQFRDLRTVMQWLKTRDGIDFKKLAVWGDSFAKVNPPDVRVAVPLDLETPSVSEPAGANLALLAGLFEDDVRVVYARGGLTPRETLTASPYLYLPHDAVIPGPNPVWGINLPANKVAVAYEATVDAQNRATGAKPMTGKEAAAWVSAKLRGK